jgi:hypothetical protein
MLEKGEGETDDISRGILGDEKDRLCRPDRVANFFELRCAIEKGTQDVWRDERTVRVFPVADLDLGDSLEIALGSLPDDRQRTLARNSRTRLIRSEAAFSS